MKPLQKRNSLLLVLAAFIWGIAFVAQSEGGKSIGPYTFNGIRFLLGAAVLCPVIFLMDKKNATSSNEAKPANRRALLMGGLSCGFILGIASTLQQLALFYGSTAGKAGFLTTCYIIIVPLLGLFLGKKCEWNIWIGTVLTLIGLYLLCMNGSFTLEFPDLLLLLCALGFSLHILCVDHFFPDGGWNQTILHTVSGGRYCFPDPGIFRGFAAFLCKCSGDAGTICRTDGTDRTFVYRYSLLRSCLYPAGHWSERSEPDGCFSADESGISIFRSGRLGTPA